MSELHETISAAKENLDSQEQVSNDDKTPESKPKNSLPITVAALVIALGLSLLLSGTTEDDVSADLPVAFVDMLMEADGSIHTFYLANGELPEQLPLEPLGHFVHYEKLNNTEYTLNLIYDGHDEVLILDINSPPSVEQIRGELGL